MGNWNSLPTADPALEPVVLLFWLFLLRMESSSLCVRCTLGPKGDRGRYEGGMDAADIPPGGSTHACW